MQRLWLVCLLAQPAPAQESRQATGIKVGEVSPASAVIWARLTAAPGGRTDGIVIPGTRRPEPLPDKTSVDELQGACPGAPGRMRLRISTRADLTESRTTDWADVGPQTDFTHQFHLAGLDPATVYYYAVDSTGPAGTPQHASLKGRFETAPRPGDPVSVTFTVVTGQAYKDLDHSDGFHIYPAMADLKPKFAVMTGDTVYYDADAPLATTVEVARHHWHRMYALPRHIAYHLTVPAYWIKDDHDTLYNDCWPEIQAESMLPMTFRDGQRIFREQVPAGPSAYRTCRWGTDLQIWLVEGRDFRSPNSMPDGPDKTIWGLEQKEWLRHTLLESDATWKVLISPTPIVGPDRAKKADNHANAAFAHEGVEFRRWARQNLPQRFFVACGDRHWQYHSVDPQTGVQEFSCGPASDQHAGGSPGMDPHYHKFHRVAGGFLSVTVDRADGRPRIAFRFHDVHGKVQYEYNAGS